MIEFIRQNLPSALEVGLALHKSTVCFENSEILGRWQLGCDIHYHPCVLFVLNGAWFADFEDSEGEHQTADLGATLGTIIANLSCLADANDWS
jgi:hypothetical protein